MNILINIFSLNPFIIVLFALVFLLIEVGAIINFIFNDYKTEYNAIEYLKRNKPQNNEVKKIPFKHHDPVYQWIFQHLKGDFQKQFFQPQFYNEQYIFFATPSFIKKAIPDSPVNFAPVFLLILGLISDLLVILQENNKSIYLNSHEIFPNFATSLTGIVLGIFLFIFFKLGQFLRKKHHDYLIQELKKIAFLGKNTSLEEEEKPSLRNLLKSKAVKQFVLTFFLVIFIHQGINNKELIKAEYENFKTSQELAEYKESIIITTKNLTKFLEENIENTENFYLNLTTGELSLNNQIFFEENKPSILTESGKSFLRKFIPFYYKTLGTLPQLKTKIKAIIIEGHTSSNGSEKANFKLSLENADVIKDYIIKKVNFPDSDYFKNKLQTLGKGEIFATKRFNNLEDNRLVFRLKLLD